PSPTQRFSLTRRKHLFFGRDPCAFAGSPSVPRKRLGDATPTRRCNSVADTCHGYAHGAATLAAMPRVITPNPHHRGPWRSGLGWTREIHAQRPDPGGDWTWRLSIAEIERDAPFSAFPGVDRELVLLRGNGRRLRFDDGESCLLEPPHGRLRFAGERPLTG